ncbi:MAG: hypothetical protein KDD44_10500 [Bdellovibrionales bacterium]|nr:hypothetical protein [Bdellovibrionales bacterium]
MIGDKIADLDRQHLFYNLLSMRGVTVRLQTTSNPATITGSIDYVSFDSLRLLVNGAPTIVQFKDILFLEPLTP